MISSHIEDGCGSHPDSFSIPDPKRRRTSSSLVSIERNKMCLACIATMTLLVAGSASTGGLTALVAKKFRRKRDANAIIPNPDQRRIRQLQTGNPKEACQDRHELTGRVPEEMLRQPSDFPARHATLIFKLAHHVESRIANRGFVTRSLCYKTASSRFPLCGSHKRQKISRSICCDGESFFTP